MSSFPPNFGDYVYADVCPLSCRGVMVNEMVKDSFEVAQENIH